VVTQTRDTKPDCRGSTLGKRDPGFRWDDPPEREWDTPVATVPSDSSGWSEVDGTGRPSRSRCQPMVAGPAVQASGDKVAFGVR